MNHYKELNLPSKGSIRPVTLGEDICIIDCSDDGGSSTIAH